jgi:ubiquitin C-terminal hydrolase
MSMVLCVCVLGCYGHARSSQWPQKDNRRFLKNIFGGVLSNQLICQEGCTHTKERKESFYSISVDVKNKPNLLKSLELYVEGEMLEGDNAYYCEPCKEVRCFFR